MAAIYPPIRSTADSSLPSTSYAGPSTSNGRLAEVPPSASSSRGSSSHRPPISSYRISTQTDGISDLRLQISLDEAGPSQSGGGSKQKEVKRPIRPLYFKERQLTESNEIRDSLVDANTARVAWSIHRPTRGWYLHIRSPLLPPGLSIPLRPARPEFVVSTMGVQDPTSTPLTFSLGTKVDYAALSNCKPWIQDWEEESKPAEESSEPPASGSGFIAVELNGVASQGNGEVSIDKPADAFVQGHTAQTSSISSMATLEPGHARRRSAGRNRSELPGTGSSPALRGFSGSFAKVEEQENEGIPEASEFTMQQESSEAADKPPSIRRPPQLQPPLQNGTSHASTEPCFSPRPLQCYFLMVDGAASSRPTSSIISPPLAPGRVAEGAHRLGWAKWIWSLVPAPVKPPLAFDTTKSFSVRWIEVPQSPDSPSSQQSQQQSIEVMRYEDEGGYWLWDSKTRGRFVYQEEAVRALGVDRGFWMAVGLAYLEFLEERDGFNASEG